MGALLDPTPDMGLWAVEVRTESAYLNGDLGAYNRWTQGEIADPPHRTVYSSKGVGFAVPVEDVPRVLAALDQIMSHPAYREWAANNSPTEDGWRSEMVDGMVRLFGPVIVFGDPAPWSPGGSVELEYRELAGLRAVLAAL